MIEKIKSLISSERDYRVKSILTGINIMHYKMIGYSFIIGLVSGGVIVVYRLLGDFFFKYVKDLYQISKTHPIYILITLSVLIIMAILVAICVKIEPNISGSGIPQVEGAISRKMKTNWKRVLSLKFVAGLLGLAAGLSVGREGPSIQMGAAIGEGISKLKKKTEYEEKYLLTAGASAGLAAAFNAPLAGVMFALEEVHKNFSPIVLMSAMISAVTADVVTKSILGITPTLDFKTLNVMPIKYYWSLVVLGIIVGISSYVFNNGIMKFKDIYKKMPIKLEFKLMIPFVMAGILGMVFPIVIGGGHHLIMDMGYMQLSILVMLGILVMKYLFTFISFSSGVPGGIFFPLLAIGAIIGNIVGILCIRYLGVPSIYLLNFAILAMAGHFAAIVKAPITGIILIFEMTGSFEQLLPLTVVVFIALITSDLLNVEPVYDLLLEFILEGKKPEHNPEDNKKTLLELHVHMGSEVDGKLVSEIMWPDNCLLVAIYRGAEEILPRGFTEIMAGDTILVMVNQNQSAKVLQKLDDLIVKEQLVGQ